MTTTSEIEKKREAACLRAEKEALRAENKANVKVGNKKRKKMQEMKIRKAELKKKFPNQMSQKKAIMCSNMFKTYIGT